MEGQIGAQVPFDLGLNSGYGYLVFLQDEGRGEELAIEVHDGVCFVDFLSLGVWGCIGGLGLRGEIYEHARRVGRCSNPLE